MVHIMDCRRLISDKLLIPVLLRYGQYRAWSWYEELVSLEQAHYAKARRVQWDRLKEIVQHASEHVPYYAESYGQAGVRAEDLQRREDLLAVPTIGKRKISSNFPDRITSRKSARDTWQYVGTSGTTDRLMVVKDAEATARGDALALYTQQMRGTYAPGALRVELPPDACSLACAAAVQRSKTRLGRMRDAVANLATRGPSGVMRRAAGAVLRRIARPSREMPSFPPAGTRVDPEMLDWYLDRIRRWRPAELSGLPTYLQLLARRLETTERQPPQIGHLLPEGALSTPGLKKELRRVFGVPVHEVYGGHEFGDVGTTCECRDRLHVVMSVCLVETVRGGRHVASGELGEIVVTAFANKTMPLIRYTPGDVGRLWEDTCVCGRRTQLLTVEGRLQDTIVTSERVRTAEEIIDFCASWPNVEFAQLVQRSETRCDLLVVERHRRRTDLADLADAAGEFLGDGMQVRPRLVSTIKPEMSGKFRFVKSISYERFHETVPVQTASTDSSTVSDSLQLQTERSR